VCGWECVRSAQEVVDEEGGIVEPEGGPNGGSGLVAWALFGVVFE
jgi:hypothetical protein